MLFADSSWSDSPVFELNLLSMPWGGTGDFPSGSSSNFTMNLLWVRRAWADSELVPDAEIPSVKAEGADELHRKGINGEGMKIGILEFSKLDSACGLFDNRFSTQEWFLCETPAFNDYHATKVAAIATGNSSTYVGSAPSSFILSYGIARVQIPGPLDQFRQAMDTGDGFLGGQLKSFAQEKADVINICIGGNQFDKHDGNHDWEHVVDHVVDSSGISVVIAEGDSDISPYICVPAASFNGITVGGAGSSLNSQQGPWDIVYPDNPISGTSDNRNKPDILAPACGIYVPKFYDEEWHTGLNIIDGGTSVATPHVTGAVALLSQVAKEQTYPDIWENPMVIKAVLMTSADKLLGENVNQRPWRHTQTQPLDSAQGAGLLNVKGAYELYINAKQGPGQVPTTGWDLGYITGDSEQNYQMNSTLNPGDQIIATLVWNRHVNDQYQASALTDLRLELRYVNSGATVDFSDSSVDNVEHIVYTVPYCQGGTYKLRVRNLSETEEDYGLAWRTIKQGSDVPTNLVSNGDFGTGNLSGWIPQGGPIVFGESEGYGNFSCARLQDVDSISQSITLPAGVSIAFDYRIEGIGSLNVHFGTELVDSISAAFDTNLHRKRYDLRQQLANYVGQQKDLTFSFSCSPGSSVYLDNICVTGDPVIGDFDHNGIVDYADLAELMSHWLKNQPSVDIAPQPNGDGIINLKDFAVLAQSWLWQAN
jgi:hypothetical protein